MRNILSHSVLQELTQCFTNAPGPRLQYTSQGKLGLQSPPDTYQKGSTRLTWSTTDPRSSSSASDQNFDGDHDYVDDLVNLYDSGLKPLHASSWNFGSKSSVENERRWQAGSVSLKSNKHHRDLRVSLRTKFYFLNERLFSFEMGIRQFTRAWASIATTDCRISVANVRPVGSLIFELCKKSDFEGVKAMLDEGRASINDVDDNRHYSLLDVRHSSQVCVFTNEKAC